MAKKPCIEIFTDGSGMPAEKGAQYGIGGLFKAHGRIGFPLPQKFSERLPDVEGHSSLTAEMSAIAYALKFIPSTYKKPVIVHTDHNTIARKAQSVRMNTWSPQKQHKESMAFFGARDRIAESKARLRVVFEEMRDTSGSEIRIAHHLARAGALKPEENMEASVLTPEQVAFAEAAAPPARPIVQISWHERLFKQDGKGSRHQREKQAIHDSLEAHDFPLSFAS